jgi:DUF971 family protein
MKPLDIQQIGNELAIRWDDHSESFIKLEKLRRYCPCAACHGESDIFGNVAKGPDIPLKASSFILSRLDNVGGYALHFVWGDGHSTGIYSFDYLKKVAEQPD